ncbi:MAG TPA: Uma2 family endonuclease [Gammaproteobacteria bacterium]|nr:Uma2 family endonuclease [Gammaproteobacteria bacterium]
MSVTKSRIPFTYEDYKSLPEAMDRRYELMDGELCLMAAPTTTHQAISQNIEFLLVQHARATRCGRVLHAPVDVVLLGESSRRDVVQPDIVFVCSARGEIVTDAEVTGAPDLLVEILSPGTEERDRGYKKTLYERNGVREYWIVDPEQESIDMFCLGAAGFDTPVRYRLDDELASTVIPDLRIPVVDVFKKWD